MLKSLFFKPDWSLEELNAETRDSFYHDAGNGWIHLKFVADDDRTKGGEVIDREAGKPNAEWLKYQTGDDAGWADEAGNPFTPIG